MSKKLPDQQMILATVSVDEFGDNIGLENATRHKLDNKLSVLNKESFGSVSAQIEQMHSETLASSTQ